MIRGEAEMVSPRIGDSRSMITHAELEMLADVTRSLPLGDPLGGHCDRVGELAGAIAAQLGLSCDYVASIREAAPLHDVGKVAVSDEILMKPGKLTHDELVIVRRHTVIGGFLLSGSDLPLLQLASVIALHHHERWDGTGYPCGLAGRDIPLAARIVALADVFDALTSERSYKAAWTIRQALTEIMSESGKQFDPRIVRALLAVILRAGGTLPAAVPTAASGANDVLSLVDRQWQREAQLQAAVASGHELERAGLEGNVVRETVVA